MRACFMFGHADCPDFVLPRIEAAIEWLYLRKGIRLFYVGNRGNFDRLATIAVKNVKRRYSCIELCLVLAYHPAERMVDLTEDFDNSFYPPLENVPRQYAIVRANQYMVEIADTFICYVAHFGNARNLFAYANKLLPPKICINVAKKTSVL